MGRPNGIDQLVRDHRDLDTLFEEYERHAFGRRSEKRELRNDLMHRIAEDLARHAELERSAFYPRLRQGLPGGDPLADAALREHEEMDAILRELERTSPDDASFDPLMTSLIERVRRHAAEEESSLFLHLDESLSKQQLEDLREKIETERARPRTPRSSRAETRAGRRASGS